MMGGRMVAFSVDGRLDGLNEYTRACRANKFAGARLKKRNQGKVVKAIRDAGLQPLEGEVSVHLTWFDKVGRNGQHRDKDNIAFAKKFVLDGMVEAGLIADDSWDTVAGFADMFIDSEFDRVSVSVMEVGR